MKTSRTFRALLCLSVLCLAGCDDTAPTPQSGSQPAPAAPTVSVLLESAGGIYASENTPAIQASVEGIATATTLTIFQVFRNPGCTGEVIAQATVPASGSPLTAQASLSVDAPSSHNYFSANYYSVDPDSGVTSATSACSSVIATTNSGAPDEPFMIADLIYRNVTAALGEYLGIQSLGGDAYDYQFSGRTSPHASYQVWADVDCGVSLPPGGIPTRVFNAATPILFGVADENGYFNFEFKNQDDDSVFIIDANTGLTFPQPLSIRAVQTVPGTTTVLKSDCVALPTTQN